jgi:DNA-binding transcriptional MocR family regulator
VQIDLQRQTGVSYIQQIKSAIADRIRSGLLEEGSLLPSVRQLAKQLSVSNMTIVQAYDELEKSGLVERIHGKGTYVRTQPVETPKDLVDNRFQWQLAIPDYLPRAQVWHFDQRPGRKQTNLAVATIDPDLLPHAEVRKALEKSLRDDPYLLTRYSSTQGDSELREEMANYHRERGIPVTAEDVLILNGAQQGIDLVARCFIGRGDVVIVEAPTYPSALDVFRGRGATVIPVPVDEEGMRLDLLTSLCDLHPPKVIYTIPTYQNPTGTVMSLRRRKQLLELASAYHCLIVEDNPWNELSFEDGPLPPTLKQLDTDGHVIHLSGFSKTVAPGCRIASLLATGTLLKRLIGAKATADLGTPLLTQKAILAFLRTKQGSSYHKKLSKLLLKKRDLVLGILNRQAPSGVRWTVPSGGVNIWITLPAWLRAEDVLIAAQVQGFAFLLGSACYPGEPEFHHLRISFALAKDEELEEAITTLCAILTVFVEQPRGVVGHDPVM